MSPPIESVYEHWRRAHGRVAALRESPDGEPPERLLQAIWVRQRLLRDSLRTPDGRLVQVLHPGFWNREPGPDFRNAVVRIGDDPAVSGDVEVDLRSEGWRGHGHDRNPGFSNVVLHVVWDAPSRRPADLSPVMCRSGCCNVALSLGRSGHQE